jgi:hypothetical protein
MTRYACIAGLSNLRVQFVKKNDKTLQPYTPKHVALEKYRSIQLLRCRGYQEHVCAS